MFFSYILLSSIIIPFVAGIGFLTFFKNTDNILCRSIALLGSALPFIFSIILYFNFESEILDSYNYEIIIPIGLESFGIFFHLGLNGISLPLYILSTIVGFCSICYALFSRTSSKNLYLGLLFVMLSGIIGTFASIDLFFFYFFHEFALIPTFIMIMIWGGAARQIIALEMTIYLTLGALLSLAGLIAFYNSSGADAFNMIALKAAISNQSISSIAQNNIFPLLLFGFGILVSLFPFHSWAPKGYGAAPTGAVMMHAGVLKKFGIYGLIQIAIPFMPIGAENYLIYLLVLGLCNILVIGLITIAQNDLKKMLGYSSIMHMGYAFIGLGTFSVLGVGGVVLLIVAHGLSVALLFLLSTMIYHRYETFNMKNMGGLGVHAPNLSLVFGLAILASVGLPGFANFWGELMIFTALAESETTKWVLYFAVLGIVISAVYGLNAIASIVFGKPSAVVKEKHNKGEKIDMNFNEKFCSSLLVFFLIIIGVFPRLITDTINDYLESSHEINEAIKENDSALSLDFQLYEK